MRSPFGKALGWPAATGLAEPAGGSAARWASTAAVWFTGWVGFAPDDSVLLPPRPQCAAVSAKTTRATVRSPSDPYVRLRIARDLPRRDPGSNFAPSA